MPPPHTHQHTTGSRRIKFQSNLSTERISECNDWLLSDHEQSYRFFSENPNGRSKMEHKIWWVIDPGDRHRGVILLPVPWQPNPKCINKEGRIRFASNIVRLQNTLCVSCQYDDLTVMLEKLTHSARFIKTGVC